MWLFWGFVIGTMIDNIPLGIIIAFVFNRESKENVCTVVSFILSTFFCQNVIRYFAIPCTELTTEIRILKAM